MSIKNRVQKLEQQNKVGKPEFIAINKQPQESDDEAIGRWMSKTSRPKPRDVDLVVFIERY